MSTRDFLVGIRSGRQAGRAGRNGALARKISADNQAAEPGQQVFEWFIDGKDVHIYERSPRPAAISR